MITLRLDSKLEQSINTIAHQMGVSRSEFIRKSITDYIDKLEQPSAWELGNNRIFTTFAALKVSSIILIRLRQVEKSPGVANCMGFIFCQSSIS